MPIRVTHLATTAADGAGIAAKRMHRALLAAGADSRMLVRDPGCTDAACGVLAPPPPTRGERLALRAPFAVSTFSRRQKTLRRLLASPGPAPELFSLPHARTRPEDHPWTREADIVHLHWVPGFVDHARFFPRVRKPLVWTLHDQQPYLGGFHYEMDRDAHPAFHALEADCLAHKSAALADLARPPLLVLGNSRWNTRRAEASGHFPPGTLFDTVYYPLDHTVYAPRDPAAARLTLALPPDRFLVGFACTDLENRRKGLADLLAALRALPASIPVTLLSFGRPPDPALLAGMPHPWIHLGYLSDDRIKAAVYAAMDCFVAPSRAEAFGQTAIEALACGVPVVASDVGGLGEAVDEGRCGLLVPPGRPELLRAAIESLQRDHTLRENLAAAGRAHVLRRHDPATHAETSLRLYAELLAAIPPNIA